MTEMIIIFKTDSPEKVMKYLENLGNLAYDAVIEELQLHDTNTKPQLN